MDTMLVLGVLITLTLLGSTFLKSYLDKKRIEQARQIVDLHDDLRRMQNAMSIIPDLYLDGPTKIFMIKRIIQLSNNIQEISNESEKLKAHALELEQQLNKILNTPDDSVKRLAQWCKIDNPDTAHEIRITAKYLHGQTSISVKNHLIPKSHGTRVVKNLKIIVYRVSLDLNYNLAKHAMNSNKLRPALGKLKLARGNLVRSPIRKHLQSQEKELATLIAQVEKKIVAKRKESEGENANMLSSGMDKMEQEEAWDTKKNAYDSD